MAKPVITKKQVYQSFDLDKLFPGFSELPEAGKRPIREAVGQLIIDRMLERTKEGKDRYGNDLKNYSEDYAKSLAFKAAGKSKNDPNMELTGEMQGLLDVIKSRGTEIKVGWTEREQILKAYNHNTGDTVPRRATFGLSAEETKRIAQEIKPDVREAMKRYRKEGKDAAVEKGLELLDKVKHHKDNVGRGDDGED